METVRSTAGRDPGELAAELGPYHFLHTILEETPNGVMVVNLKHVVIHANPAANHFLGMEYDELSGRPLAEILEPYDSSIMKRALTAFAASQQGKVVRLEHELQIESGGDDYILRAAVVFPSTSLGYYLFYLIDITQQKMLERALQQRNTFFQNLIDSSIDGIIASDMKGTIVLFSKGAQDLLGYTSEETSRLHVTQLYNEGLAYELIKRMRSDDFGGKGKLLRHELSVKHKDGSDIPVSFSGGIIYDRDTEVATFGLFTDLRAMQQIEEDLEHTHKMLLQSEKMAGLGRLAAGVAHEINNPMSGIMLYANLVMEDLGAEHSLAPDLQTIIHEAERCKVIVADLLEFSHQTSYEMEPTDLNEVVRKTLTILQHQPLFHNIDIKLDLADDLPLSYGNSIRLNQVVMNVVVNGAQAMDGKGKLRISTKVRANKDINEILIADDGPGIEPHLIEKIFDPFFTTKATGEGTGLGLSVSYAIIKEHKGTIRVESAPGEGTTFAIRLPAILEQLSGENHGQEFIVSG